jgi:hypothetical protein
MIWNKYRFKKECLATYDELIPAAPKAVAFSEMKKKVSWFQILVLPLSAVGVMALTVFLVKGWPNQEQNIAKQKSEVSATYLAGSAFVKPLGEKPVAPSSLQMAYVPNWHYDTMKTASFILDFFASLYAQESFPLTQAPVDFTCSIALSDKWTLYNRLQLRSDYDEEKGTLVCQIHAVSTPEEAYLASPLYDTLGFFEKMQLSFEPSSRSITSYQASMISFASSVDLATGDWLFIHTEGAKAYTFEAEEKNGVYSEEDQAEFARLKNEAIEEREKFKVVLKSAVKMSEDYSDIYREKAVEHQIFN